MFSSRHMQIVNPPSVLSKVEMCTRRLSIPGRLDQIARVGQLVDECAQIAGFDDRTSYACQLAVGEACENIIKHAYGSESTRPIEVVVLAECGKLTIELVDDGPPFNVAQKPVKNNVQVDDPPIGGLGLRIIHKVMDRVEYHRLGNQNHLKLQKSCNPSVT